MLLKIALIAELKVTFHTIWDNRLDGTIRRSVKCYCMRCKCPHCPVRTFRTLSWL